MSLVNINSTDETFQNIIKNMNSDQTKYLKIIEIRNIVIDKP